MSHIKLFPEDARLTTYPIFRQDIWRFVKKSQQCYWVPEEVNLSQDRIDFKDKLTEGERRLVKYILAFFAASDGIVNVNLAKRFKVEFNILEVGYFYDFQMMMENIHAEMYSVLLDTLIDDPTEKARLLDSAQCIPVIKRISDFMYACINSNEHISLRLFRMACVEGMLFNGCFCVIYWLQNNGLMPGLGQSNELIGRDEGLHAAFALYLFTILEERVPAEAIHAVLLEAVDVAKDFILEALPLDLPTMNATLMTGYIECISDNLLLMAGFPRYFGTNNPFSFMEMINLTNYTNYFERRVSEYSKPAAATLEKFEVANSF